MKVGFGKTDITPRLGVELCGFGPFRNRRAVAVRDQLWAKAMAIEAGDKTAILVSCDLIGVELGTTRRVREFVCEGTGVREEAVMVHCTHTHSGPGSVSLIGCGAADAPYMEILPHRIARACIEAFENKVEATLSHAEVPCEGIGVNREYDKAPRQREEALSDGWRPRRPELTDVTTHVLKFESEGRLIGFASYFGAHPVVCCQDTHYLHGDFPGVATNIVEREYPGAVGMFLQGALGDVNTCVAHEPEEESLKALDIIAVRYGDAVREGLTRAEPLAVESVACILKQVTFTRTPKSLEELRRSLSEYEEVFAAPHANDQDRDLRMAAVYAVSLRKIIDRLESGKPMETPTELQGFRFGSLVLLGAPFEIFQAIKNDVVAQSDFPVTLVLGLTNDYQGYAPDRCTASRGGYAPQRVPIMLAALPWRDIHGELVQELKELLGEIY